MNASTRSQQRSFVSVWIPPASELTTKRRKVMRTTKLRNPGLVILALAVLSILVAPNAKAACGAHNSDGLSPALRSLQVPAMQGDEPSASQIVPPESQAGARNGSEATILGMWKIVAYSGGELNDVGFEQFSAGGTELVNDVGAFNAGNNFCVGAWKQVGPRSYDLVHPFFIFDGTNAIGVCIVKAHFLVSRAGNTFTATWSQDNYDLYGNLIPGTHFDGTQTGTRIAPDLEYPWPLPL
jgi:hypothetical protein